MTGSRHGLSQPTIPPPLRQSIRRKLLRWYDRHKRDLPWRRRAGDPYAQWVAEIMLQQTRVETVIPYYERFMKRFPTVEALARAKHETVLKHWEGLGYYRRILHLHDAARLLRRQKRGVPETAVELLALPGVGEYTAAAIASIAYGKPVAAVEGNVARVVARLCGIDTDILTPNGRKRIRHATDQLLARRRPGDFNQAWMDLGSAVCTPKSPRCDTCPLASDCLAAATGQAESLPIRDGNRRKPREVSLLAVVFQCNGKILLRRRPKGGLWSGLWELPTIELNGDHREAKMGFSLSGRTGLILDDLAKQHDLTLENVPVHAGTVRHQLTHLSLTFQVLVAAAAHSKKKANGRILRWVPPIGLSNLSVSTAQRKALRVAAPLLWNPTD